MIVKIKLNQNLSTPKGKLFQGETVEISCDNEGTPLDKFWRNRFADQKIDNSFSIIPDEKVEEKKESEPSQSAEESTAKNSQSKSKK